MKIPLSLLQKYIELDLSAEEIGERLTMAGLEVDGIETSPLGFEGVVVGEVISAEQHPDADKLKVATVSDGEENYQVVCGAPNCRPGLKTAFARVGAKIQDHKIKKGKLRGVVSFGMLCSETELGIGEEASGIAELPETAVVGQDLTEMFGDTIFEIALTPNLGHCSSVLGVARELSAMLQKPLSPPPIEAPKALPDPIVKVSIEAKEDCPRYACQVVKGVKNVGEVVDLTNQVMLELGQPMHAFDLGKIEGEVAVRHSKKGEKLTTLDGEERNLEAGMLIIADQKGPIALAGVMGGDASKVTDDTRDILLESAYFTPQAVRRTCKQLVMGTDSSRRFERGTDPNQVLNALAMAASVIDGEAHTVVDLYETPIPQKSVSCRLSRINLVLGTSLSLSEAEDLLRRLEFEVRTEGETISALVPSYRSDINIEIDLIEEVGRLFGFNNLPKRAARYTSSTINHTPLFLFEREMRTKLIAEGLHECVNNTLISSEHEGIRVLNPSSLEHSVLRTSLMPGLLRVVAHNQRQQIRDVAAFEIGQVHFEEGERSVAALIANLDFLETKGIVENVIDATFKRSSYPDFHPGRQAEIYAGGEPIGVIGEALPALLRKSDIKGAYCYAELNLNALINHQKARHYQPLPLYPGSDRDWTVTVAEEVEWDEIRTAIEKVPSRLLKEIELKDIYRSDAVGEGWKNVTLRLSFRDNAKTVAIKAVEAEHQRITENVMKQVRCKS